MAGLILQMVGCLLIATIIGLLMGWFLRSFATSEKRQQLSEIATAFAVVNMNWTLSITN